MVRCMVADDPVPANDDLSPGSELIQSTSVSLARRVSPNDIVLDDAWSIDVDAS